MRVPDIARACGKKFRLELVAKHVGDRPQKVEYRAWLAGRHVDGLACEAWRLRCKDVRLDYVADVRKVSRLAPIVIDRRTLAAHVRGDEAWDRRGVRGTGILAWPEDIEVAKADRAHAMELSKHTRVALRRELGDRIRRSRPCRHDLAHRWLCDVSVHRRGR